ncbi:hypothetical protein B484DRAFT_450194 [Ochromonadaceae sp. CCMP2298]|nr:hypothetical protein B484DRAFT_450194 [Ochromonadaceae sp. CCMP2298]|mmetsp:Transcript_10190/g.22599  ORF Transcript_10190/g.22599 Transcript_10190/m.22599 type:complete len:382 (+) Transcript_10190:40-1185(+)
MRAPIQFFTALAFILPVLAHGSTPLWLLSITKDVVSNIASSLRGKALSTDCLLPQFANATVFISGANGGIGRGIVDILNSFGASKPRLFVQSRLARALDYESNSLTMDFTDLRSLSALKHMPEGGIDVVIHNAGLMSSTATVRDVHQVNCLAPFLSTLFLLPPLLNSSKPKIVVVSSSSHLRGRPYQAGDLKAYMADPRRSAKTSLAAYAASKYNIMLLSVALKNRLRGCGVVLSTIHPGLVDTPMLQGFCGMGFPGRGRVFLSPRRGAMNVLVGACQPEAAAPVDYLVNGKSAPFFTARSLIPRRGEERLRQVAEQCFRECLSECPASVRVDLIDVLAQAAQAEGRKGRGNVESAAHRGPRLCMLNGIISDIRLSLTSEL